MINNVNDVNINNRVIFPETEQRRLLPSWDRAWSPASRSRSRPGSCGTTLDQDAFRWFKALLKFFCSGTKYCETTYILSWNGKRSALHFSKLFCWSSSKVFLQMQRRHLKSSSLNTIRCEACLSTWCDSPRTGQRCRGSWWWSRKPGWNLKKSNIVQSGALWNENFI